VVCVGLVAFGDLSGVGLYRYFVLGVGFVSGMNLVAVPRRNEMLL